MTTAVAALASSNGAAHVQRHAVADDGTRPQALHRM